MRAVDYDELMKFPIRENRCDKAHGNKNFIYGVECVFEYITEMPIIDVQPVIKCRDCRYAILTSDGMCKYCTSGIFTTELCLDGDFYCANAERKEKDNNE